jgi:signal transduction histidine kinase
MIIMFRFLSKLSLFSILIIVFLFIVSVISLSASFLSLQNSFSNTVYIANDLIATNYAYSLTLSFKFTSSPLDYGKEFMNRYSIFNSDINDFTNLSALNNTSINDFVNSLNVYYIVNNIDRSKYEMQLSQLINKPIMFTDISNSIINNKDIYLPTYFSVPITSRYTPGLDILSIPLYNNILLKLINLPISTIITNTRKGIFNNTLFDFGIRTNNGIAVVTVIIENIITEYISDNEKISLSINNNTFFNNCIDYCDNKIDKNILLPNNELVIATIYFNKTDIDITSFLFILLAILLFDSIVLFIILNFEVQKNRFFLADKMLGYINHEIRNPLNCINGMIDISILQYEDENLINDNIDILTDLTTAKIACQLLSYIINDIIDLKNMNNEILVINKEKIDINIFFKDLQKILEIKINENSNISFVIENPDNIQTIYFDKQRLFQITINFLHLNIPIRVKLLF